MAAIAVFQDQENVIQEQGKNLSARRAAPKPFLAENMHQATPRKALGDVRNIQIPRQIHSGKAAIQSDKKNHSSVSRSTVSSFRKPFGTAKKGKNAIRILEDETVQKADVKENTKTKQREACTLQDRTQKEDCFPFIDTDFQFSMPNYLKDLPNWNISDHVKLPSHTWCRKEQDLSEFDVDLSEMRTESLPIHLELEDSLLENMLTDVLGVSTELPSCPDKIFELNDIECDFEDIDSYCSPETDYPDIMKKFDAIDLCCIEDAAKNNEHLDASRSNRYLDAHEVGHL